MRVCGRCKEEKSLSEFAWRRKARGQRDNYCRPCRAAYKHEHYSRNRQRYIDSARRRTERIVAERTAYLMSLFREHPCVDCGEGDPLVLEFDHLREKQFGIGKGMRERPWKDVLAEIAKCDVVCANCHRRRTNRRGGFIRTVVTADMAVMIRVATRQANLVVCLAAALVTLGMGGCGSSESGSTRDGNSSPLVNWPLFGRVPERTHYLPDEGRDLDPPLREAWSINTHALIEFPPALAGGVAYVANKYGDVRAVRLRDHKVLWERVTDHRLSGPPTFVTAPIYHQGRVFLAFLDGNLMAVDAATGKTVWKHNLHAHLESSPLAVGGDLFLGDDKTNLVSLRASDGKIRWQFNSPGAIKASPSYHDGRVYVADYQSAMFCADADSGKLLWRTNTSKVAPFGDGGFYSSPAVAFGHVYAARDDGTVYAFDEKTGRVDWFFSTHNFIYGSPAVAHVPGTPPSVYIGGYDEHLYALDARSGKQRWRFAVGGPVPGTSTVIGHTVYTSSFKTRATIGVDARSGKKTFFLRQAGYTPVVSDGRRLFAIGYYELIGLEPAQH